MITRIKKSFLKEKIGDTIKEALLPFIKVLKNVVTYLNEHPKLIKAIIVAIGTFAAVLVSLKIKQIAYNTALAITNALTGNWVALAAAAAAGACGVVLECVPAKLAAEITSAIQIPTIGIGAGPDCNGQVLVLHDLIGLSIDRIPRFVRSYADTKGTILDAVTSWRQDVESKKFPGESETLA